MDTRRKPEDIVLDILSKIKACNINCLRKETGLSYYTLVKAINNLVSRGLVIEKRVGRARIIEFAENP